MKIFTKTLLCLLVLASTALAQTPTAAPNSLSVSWFVELKSLPLADGGSAEAVQSERQSFRQAARSAGIAFRERFVYENLFNGLSMEISPADVARLSTMDNVKAIYPVHRYQIPVTQPVSPQLATALAMTGADIAHSELGLTGAGVRVGIIDTGIDYNHPDLGGGFGAGFRVATGYDFVGNAYDGTNDPVPDADPDDCNGHGTHVAGIVGANGKVVGVAPKVTFGAYRVFGCTGETTSEIIIAALERALRDRMNVVNLSLGQDFLWPRSPEAVAANRLVNNGIVVVAAMGNAGDSGLYSAGAPAVGSKVIAVASFDNTNSNLSYFTVAPDNTKVGYQPAEGSPAPPTSGTIALARTGTAASTADACAELPADSLTGKAALVRRGTCSFYIKARNAQLAGAAAVVIYNNAAGRLSIIVAGTPAVTIPVVSISDTEGLLIDTRLSASPTPTTSATPLRLTWTDQLASFPNATGGLISSFSSYGLSPNLALKPDIGAPGGFVRSTYPLELGGYAVLSGTSMSSPHVAGAAALLLQARPRIRAREVNEILQNSAEPRPWLGNPALGYLEVVHRQGAGMLRIDRAILATSRIEPGKLSLGESQSGPAIRTLRIENNSNRRVTYTMSHVPALATGPSTFTPSILPGFARVRFSRNSVVVRPGESAEVTVIVTPAATLPDHSLYGGYIVFSASNGETYRVPYAGFKGDYQSIQVLTPTPAGFPWLGRFVGTSFTNQPNGGSFTLVGPDVPFILLHLDHQSRRLSMEVFDAKSGKSMNLADDESYLPRNSTPTTFFAVPWDGTTFRGRKTDKLPNGEYVIKVTIRKAKAIGQNINDNDGDDDDNDDANDAEPSRFETWTSPVITIARP